MNFLISNIQFAICNIRICNRAGGVGMIMGMSMGMGMSIGHWGKSMGMGMKFLFITIDNFFTICNM